MSKWLTLIIGGVLLAGLSIGEQPALAHHGRGNTYDTDSEIALEGKVKELVWRNPHVSILLDVEDESGSVVTWAIEHSNVSSLARLGYSRRVLVPGQQVTAYVNPGAEGQPLGLCRRIILEDGTEIFRRGRGVD